MKLSGERLTAQVSQILRESLVFDASIVESGIEVTAQALNAEAYYARLFNGVAVMSGRQSAFALSQAPTWPMSPIQNTLYMIVGFSERLSAKLLPVLANPVFQWGSAAVESVLWSTFYIGGFMGMLYGLYYDGVLSGENRFLYTNYLSALS